jgi:23S rRNA (adenine2503-C2)-methyltransferase
MMEDILSADLPELTEFLSSMGEKPFRARQIYEWLHARNVKDFSGMTNLSKPLREALAENCPLHGVRTETMQESGEDGTRKYLFRLHDGNFVESVLMKYRHGDSVCISSQVGCRMGCRFCASTLDGWTRNLTPGEMLSQIYEIQRDIGERISNVVVMGTGEPLDNYDSLVRFIRMLTDENGLHISQRNVTVSTCGLVPGIRKLAEEGFQISLALSLHAPDDEKRRTIMPVAKQYPLREVMAAMDEYYRKSGRRLTFEYSLIRGVNDSESDADALSGLLRGRNCLVNLIFINPIKERNFRESGRPEAAAFKKKLEKNGIHVTIRREMGRDIDGACGQLRKRYMT